MTMLKSFKSGTNGGNGGIEKLSREQIIDMLEIGAKRRLGMSAKQMFKAYKKGKLKDIGEVHDLIGLSYGLPEDDPIFG